MTLDKYAKPEIERRFRLDGVPMLWEDTHVITETGHEQLTLETPELREIPF